MTRLAIVLLLSGVLLAACNSGTEVPDGFTEAEAGPVTFAHPEDWSETSATGGAALQIEGPSGAGGVQTGVQVFVDEQGGDPAARASALAAALRTSFEDFEVTEQTESEVEGAEAATLLEYTFDADGTTVRSYDVLAEGPDGDQIIFRVAGAENELDADTAGEIIDTLSLE